MIEGNGSKLAEFTAIDAAGQQVLQQTIPVGEYAGSFMNRREGRLHQMLAATLGNGASTDPAALLIVHPVDRNHPEAILTEEPYRRFRKLGWDDGLRLARHDPLSRLLLLQPNEGEVACTSHILVGCGLSRGQSPSFGSP